jgi:hypothetical protein
MRIYTVHELPGAPLDGAGIVLVKEGFSFPAFAFSWAWLLWHRLWIAFCVWLGLTAALSFLMQMAFGAGAAMACSLALQFLLGTEANDIRRWTIASWVSPVAAASRKRNATSSRSGIVRSMSKRCGR